jgi:uncharacterized repeat protein (TIGR02543 family)
VRDGYTFRHWAVSPAGGAQFTAATVLTGHITVYAIWAEIPPVPVPPAPPAPPAPNVIVNNPPSGGGDITYVTVPPDMTAAVGPDATSRGSQGAASTSIDNAAVPLAGQGSQSTWSLFNLIATVLALLLVVVFVVRFFFDRPRKDAYVETPIDEGVWAAMTAEQRKQLQARREAERQAWMVWQQTYTSRQKLLYVNLPVLLVAMLALVEAVVMYLATQTIQSSMVFVDDYSVLFTLIVFVQLLVPVVAAAFHNNKMADQRQEQGAASVATPPQAAGAPQDAAPLQAAAPVAVSVATPIVAPPSL